MARLARPLFSSVARGTVAQCLTYRRGTVHPCIMGYHEHPINWTPAKIKQAQSWKAKCNQWRALSQEDKDYWSSQAPAPLTGFNLFMQQGG